MAIIMLVRLYDIILLFIFGAIKMKGDDYKTMT
jgi:hypothetical protein